DEAFRAESFLRTDREPMRLHPRRLEEGFPTRGDQEEVRADPESPRKSEGSLGNLEEGQGGSHGSRDRIGQRPRAIGAPPPASREASRAREEWEGNPIAARRR